MYKCREEEKHKKIRKHDLRTSFITSAECIVKHEHIASAIPRKMSFKIDPLKVGIVVRIDAK